MHWVAILLYSLVAAGTLALAGVTYFLARQARKQNKVMSEWYQPNERFRVLPFLHLSFVNISLDGCLYTFGLKNIGWGPAIFTVITALNHKNLKEIKPDAPFFNILLVPGESTSIGYILEKEEGWQFDFEIHCRDVRKEHIEFRYHWFTPLDDTRSAYSQPYFEEAIFWKEIVKKGKRVKVQIDRI